MKKLLLLICLGLLLFSGQKLQAQIAPPNGFNYQAIVRNATGDVLANQEISVKVSILSDTLIPTVEYVEVHGKIQTNRFGLINLIIGKGKHVGGLQDNLLSIPWHLTNQYIKIEVDKGEGFIPMGIMIPYSVPYAFVAGRLADPSVMGEIDTRAGDPGPTGPQGEVGPTGPQGETGPTGPQGANGTDGATGAQGAAGVDGGDGAQGPAGATGPQGIAGNDGADGAQGPQGPAGATGPQGAQGNAGAQGATGPQGAAGARGNDGADGANGATGPQGTAGAQGAQGPQGLQGIQGVAGNDGADGADGATGPQGLQGPTGIGTAGPTGPQGVAGATGAAGATGPAGEGAGQAWLLNGNAGAGSGTQFIGTTDLEDLTFRTNSTEIMRLINSKKSVGIGTNLHSNSKLHVLSTNIDHVAYFEQKLLSGTSDIVYANFTGTKANKDIIAFNGSAISNDWYGYGAYLTAGYIGAYAEVMPTGSQTYYGFRTYVEGGTGLNHGFRNQVYNGRKSYGFRNQIYDADTSYGLYNELNDNTGTNLNYGEYNILNAKSTNSYNYGSTTIIKATGGAQQTNVAFLGNITGGNNTLYNTGMDFVITATGTSTSKGASVVITGGANSINYGYFGTVSGSGAGVTNIGMSITAGVNTGSAGLYTNMAGNFTTYAGAYGVKSALSYSSGSGSVSNLGGYTTEAAAMHSRESNNTAEASYGMVGSSTSSGSQNGIGVLGESSGGSSNSIGVMGISNGGGSGVNAGVYGKVNGSDANDYAGYFEGSTRVVGNLTVTGDMNVAGAKSFKIDHPLDPANKYLVHYCVEAPEAQNVYNGNIVTDVNGNAIVTLPAYFDAINTNIKYQLTVIGGEFAQVIVSSEVRGNSFTIKTDKPNIKVSWQVTATRNDAYSKAHGFVAEQVKTGAEQGTYLSPELYGQPATTVVGGGATATAAPSAAPVGDTNQNVEKANIKAQQSINVNHKNAVYTIAEGADKKPSKNRSKE